MTQTIVITSGKGGVGKTNISVNTAIELARRNYRTCLFDADLGLANVNILLGIQPENSLDDFISGRKTLDEILVRTEYDIDVIPGSSGVEKMANLDKEELSGLVASFGLISGYDFFLIDTASGISRSVLAFCLSGSETIIVITAEATSLTDAYALLKVMAAHQYQGTVKILVNKSASIPQAKETYHRFKEVVTRHLDIRIAPAGIILFDPNLETAISSQQPMLTLFPESLGSQCIKALVSSLLKKENDTGSGEDFSDFWQRYFEYALPLAQDSDNQQDSRQSVIPPTSRSRPLPEEETGQAESSGQPPAENKPLAGPDSLPTSGRRPKTTKAATISPLPGDGTFDPAELTPPIPLLSKALELQAEGKMSGETLLEFFSSDALLMVKALKIYYRLGRNSGRVVRLTDRRQLLEEVGRETLTNLLNATCIQAGLHPVQAASCQGTSSALWSHGSLAARLAKNIAETTAYPFPEEAFIAGLIHDIGRIPLQAAHPEIYEKTISSDGDVSQAEVEYAVCRTTHAELGGATLRTLGLDSFLVDAVWYHNEPVSRIESAFSLVKIVYLAARLADQQDNPEETFRLGESLFGLGPEQLQTMFEAATRKTRLLGEKFGIGLRQETADPEMTGLEARFRQQVLDYSVLQGVLPPANPARDLSTTLATVFQAFTLLFNFDAAYLLLKDEQDQLLKAALFPGCFGEETVADMQFSLYWHKSLVVQAIIDGELRMALDGESSGVLPLADRQLLRALGAEGFVCVPLKAGGTTCGLLVFGIAKSQFDRVQSKKSRLLHFGAQAAANISTQQHLSVNETGPPP